jgi:preprotein translocase subunit SecG
MQLVITLLYILFVLAAIVLIVVILLQEGKGGGLTDALGTSGQATFGVGASGINRFTGITAAVFLVAALLIHILNRRVGEGSLAGEFGPPTQSAPAQGGAAIPPPGGAPATTPGQTPPAPPSGTAPSGGTPPSNPAPSGGTPQPSPPNQPPK